MDCWLTVTESNYEVKVANSRLTTGSNYIYIDIGGWNYRSLLCDEYIKWEKLMYWWWHWYYDTFPVCFSSTVFNKDYVKINMRFYKIRWIEKSWVIFWDIYDCCKWSVIVVIADSWRDDVLTEDDDWTVKKPSYE